MKVRLRLIVWIAAGAGALLSQWLNLSPWSAVSCLAVLAILLWTTPANAIRLPTRLSAVLIVGGVLTLQIAAIERGRTTPLAAVIVLFITGVGLNVGPLNA